MASAATLIRSSNSYRGQGSSGRVWGEDSIPGMFKEETSPLDQKSFASDIPPQLFHSRSTGFIEAPQIYFHSRKSGKGQPDASRKPRFRLGKWIKKFLRKSS